MVNTYYLCNAETFTKICSKIQNLESHKDMSFEKTTKKPVIGGQVKEEGFDQVEEEMDVCKKTKLLANFILSNVEQNHKLAPIGIATLSNFGNKVKNEKAAQKIEEAITKLDRFADDRTELKNQKSISEEAASLIADADACIEQKNFKEARKLLKRAAMTGDPAGQRELGTHYSLGKIFPKNDSEALKWLKQAAAQGDFMAQNNYACHLAQGEGIEQDDVKAFKYYKKAASGNLAVAQASVGFAKEYGLGTTKNLHKAKKYYKLAAEQEEQLGIEGYERLNLRSSFFNRVSFCLKALQE